MRFKIVIEKMLPPRLYLLVVRMFRIVRPLWYIGDNVTCPLCEGHFREFAPAGLVNPRLNAQCPRCGSRKRQRLLWFYLKDKTQFFTDHLKVLHVAPSYPLQKKFRKLKNLDYISADLLSPTAMVKMDITDIHLPDNQFDCIICYHVLEHILDDGKAMRELFRVLKPGGWAILQVPIDPNRDKTFEDPAVVSPKQRERIFGQYNHVRIYGLDYKDRLEATGFTVKVDNYVRQLPDDFVEKYALMKEEKIYLCSKPE
jgi:predicted SAM-dependent methyltransferase